MVSTVTQILSVLTVLGEAIVVPLVLDLLLNRKSKNYFLANIFGKHAILFAFLFALVAMTGSLFFSEVAGYAPCTLCWYQRILMYSQVFILGLALKRKDDNIIPYSILLSSIGAVIAGYHYLLQLGVAPGLPCSAVGYSASCSQRFILTFGHITIPFMALTAFALILSVFWAKKATRSLPAN